MKTLFRVNEAVLKKIQSGPLTFTFLPSGDLHSAYYQHIQINQLIGNDIDGSLNNLYLRLYKEEDIQVYPLIGKDAAATFYCGQTSAKWVGRIDDLSYQVSLYLNHDAWFWQVELFGHHPKADVIYGQDLGLATSGSLQANESYVSQYIDHQVLEDEVGFKVCSRQNQEQTGRCPYMQQGILSGSQAVGYSTDGFQFFGLDYKFDRKPKALQQPKLDNQNLQYEMAYTALQTEGFKLETAKQIIFYGFVQDHLAHAVKKIEFGETIRKRYEGVSRSEAVAVSPRVQQASFRLDHLNGLPLTPQELATFYPEAKRQHIEESDDTLLSFFMEDHTHIVLPAKERQMERPHAHILLSGNTLSFKEPGLASTSFIYGLFNAQTVMGNTTMNKWLSNQRNHLNAMTISGQRLFIKIADTYHRLAMPSVFEMGFNYCRWLYKLDDDVLIVTNLAANQHSQIQLSVTSQQDKTYDFLLTNQAIMHDTEYQREVTVTESEGNYWFTASKQSACQQGNPDLTYGMTFDCREVRLVDLPFMEGASFAGSSLVAFAIPQVANWRVQLTGCLKGELSFADPLVFAGEKAQYQQFIEETLSGLSLTSTTAVEESKRLNTIVRWYTQNMLIHYLSPHGLEQYGGAAWGTRDVCQGPLEFFLATQHDDVVRELLCHLFSHQHLETGNWPQWFMFDDYRSIFAEESHGDVIVWPIMALGQYLEATGDVTILDECVPYINQQTGTFTQDVYSLRSHVLRELDYIKQHFLFGTHLSAYGDGDWDDTLQPANQQLKKQMVSSWTVALTYQALTKLSKNLQDNEEGLAQDLARLAAAIAQDYRRYLLSQNVLPGFLYLHDDMRTEVMIHPTDQKTGIAYRLLPMTRSMIAELLTEEEVATHMDIIDNYLTFPDGIRLMNKPAHYSGGNSVHFKRAEQAANVGREIGLLYVHAQIRYVEAMCKIGQPNEAWRALHQTIPIKLQTRVPQALPRQSNTYFSSSDAAFATRYDAQEQFHQLKAGEVPVKGGWRLYSSGPGIFINQLITNVLGIRRTAAGVAFDPVLPEHVSDLSVQFALYQQPVKIQYSNQATAALMIDEQPVEACQTTNRYRKTGHRITKQQFLQQTQRQAKITIRRDGIK